MESMTERALRDLTSQDIVYDSLVKTLLACLAYDFAQIAHDISVRDGILNNSNRSIQAETFHKAFMDNLRFVAGIEQVTEFEIRKPTS